MTRQQAIEALWVPSPAQSWAMGASEAGDFVDRLVALGLLKLDGPKSAPLRLFEALESAGVSTGGFSHFYNCIEQANLKIVEK